MLTITEDQLKEAMARLSRTQDGRVVLRYLMAQCGFTKPSISINETTREINIQATLYDEARRNLWLSMRKFIDRDSLIEIEHPSDPNKSQDEESKEWLEKQEKIIKEQPAHKGTARQAQKRLAAAKAKREAAEAAAAQASKVEPPLN